MHNAVFEALETLEVGRGAARMVIADNDLTDAAKARIAQEVRRQYADEARRGLSGALTAAQKRRQTAEAALLAARQKAGKTPDTSRQLLVAERCKAAENDRARLTAIVLAAVEGRNADDLAAVADFALPRLAKLQTLPDGTAAGDRLRPGTFRLLEAQVTRAIADTEPADLAAARAELAAAADDLATLTSDVRRVDLRYSETRGGAGPFGDLLTPAEAPSVTLDSSGMVKVISGGAWL